MSPDKASIKKPRYIGMCCTPQVADFVYNQFSLALGGLRLEIDGVSYRYRLGEFIEMQGRTASTSQPALDQ